MLNLLSFYIHKSKVERELKYILLLFSLLGQEFGQRFDRYPEVKALIREGNIKGWSILSTAHRCAAAYIEIVVKSYSPEMRRQIVRELATIDYGLLTKFMNAIWSSNTLPSWPQPKMPVTFGIAWVIMSALANRENNSIDDIDRDVVMRQIYGAIHDVPDAMRESVNTELLLPVDESSALEAISVYKESLKSNWGAEFSRCMEAYEEALQHLEDDSSIDFREAGIKAYKLFADEVLALSDRALKEELGWLDKMEDQRLYEKKVITLHDFLNESRELLASWGRDQFGERILEIANSKPDTWDPSERGTPESFVEPNRAVEGKLNASIGDYVFARAREISAERGQPFQTGQNVPAHTVESSILGPDGRPVQLEVPAQYASYSGTNLHAMKQAFDELVFDSAVQARWGIGEFEVNAIRAARNDYINWVESKLPEYKTARQNYAERSNLINRSMIGQYLKGPFLDPTPDDITATQDANSFLDAVRAVKEKLVSGTGLPYGSDLEDLMTAEDIKILDNVRRDMAREVRDKELVSLAMGRPCDGLPELKSQLEAYESILTESWLFAYEMCHGLVPEGNSERNPGYGPIDFDEWQVWKGKGFEMTGNLWFNHPGGLPPQLKIGAEGQR